MDINEYVEMAAGGQQEFFEFITNEPWYQNLPETTQAEFWTEVLIHLRDLYHEEKLNSMLHLLDEELPGPVHDMLYANLQQYNHTGKW